MQKRTWRFTSLLSEVGTVMASAPSYAAAAKALKVNPSTLHRWRKAGKIGTPGGRPRRVTVPASPDGWAAAVREAYVLSATETTLVDLAEVALSLANNESLTPLPRLAAMARFAQLVKQLNLEVPDSGHAETTPPIARSWPRRFRLK